MDESDLACGLDDTAKFEAMASSARPFPRSRAQAFQEELRAVRQAEETTPPHGVALRRASFEKWRLIHEWTRHHPFRDDPRARRSEQWRAALTRLGELRDGELIDWLALQIEVATHLENGIQDLRPRDPGPTWLVTLEYVGNRKRKALAVLHWAEAAEKEGCFTVDSDWHQRTAEILGREPTPFERGDGGHEGVPFVVGAGE